MNRLVADTNFLPLVFPHAFHSIPLITGIFSYPRVLGYSLTFTRVLPLYSRVSFLIPAFFWGALLILGYLFSYPCPLGMSPSLFLGIFFNTRESEAGYFVVSGSCSPSTIFTSIFFNTRVFWGLLSSFTGIFFHTREQGRELGWWSLDIEKQLLSLRMDCGIRNSF